MPISTKEQSVLERRLHPRRTVSLLVHLVDANDCITSCRVLDISAEGARILIGPPPYAFLPGTLKLALGTREGPARRAKVIWRDGVEVGVYFLPEVELSASGARAAARARGNPAKQISVAELRKLVK